MKSLIFAALAASVALSFVASSAAAEPRSWTVMTNGPHGNSTTTIVPHAGGSLAQITHLPPMTLEQTERDAAWAMFCEPKIIAQAPDWVPRYTYKHPGCENGRSE